MQCFILNINEKECFECENNSHSIKQMHCSTNQWCQLSSFPISNEIFDIVSAEWFHHFIVMHAFSQSDSDIILSDRRREHEALVIIMKIFSICNIEYNFARISCGSLQIAIIH